MGDGLNPNYPNYYVLAEGMAYFADLRVRSTLIPPFDQFGTF